MMRQKILNGKGSEEMRDKIKGITERTQGRKRKKISKKERGKS